MTCGSLGGAARLRPTHSLLPLRAPLGCPSSGQPPRHPAPCTPCPSGCSHLTARSRLPGCVGLPAGRGAHPGAEAAWPRAPPGTFLPRHAQALQGGYSSAHHQGCWRGHRERRDPAAACRAASRASPHPQASRSPGPQTVDLTPVFSSTGTRLTAPSMCWVNTSQSRSKRPKANLSDTWGGWDLPVMLPVGGAASPQVSDSWAGPHSCPPSPPISRACLPSGPPALPLTVAVASAWRPRPRPPPSRPPKSHHARWL